MANPRNNNWKRLYCMVRVHDRIFNMKRWLIKEYDGALLGMDRIYNKIHNLFFERAIFDSGMLTIAESFCYLFFMLGSRVENHFISVCTLC